MTRDELLERVGETLTNLTAHLESQGVGFEIREDPTLELFTDERGRESMTLSISVAITPQAVAL